MEASARGRVDVAQLLLGKGADPNAKNREGKAARELLPKDKHPDIVEFLRAHGPKE
jgi:ankyrin repeat protein